MVDSTRSAPLRPDPNAGIYRHSLAALSASLAYLKARLQLAGLEGKEAGIHYVVILALAVTALLVVFFGYFFFCLAVVFLIAWALGDGHAWIWVTLGMAALHFIGAAILGFMAKNRLEEPMFSATVNEFKKDHEWLNSNSANHH